MSGPVRAADTAPEEAQPREDGDDRDGPSVGGVVEVLEARATEVGGVPVRRLLPKRTRRMVGAWCFVDHFGPADARAAPMRVGPHPHIGLHTVTWVLDGEVVHRDSLGHEQPIRPGQLNLMTAGRGVAHAEETPEAGVDVLRGLQLWVAQPDATRDGDAAFEHHAELPVLTLGAADVTVLLGWLAGARSPARTDTDIVGADLRLRGGPANAPIDARFEHAVAVVEGDVAIDGRPVPTGSFAYLPPGRDELTFTGTGQLLLIGGAPFGETITMWWNFVARTRDEVERAATAWNGDAAADRFGDVTSRLDRIAAPRPNWRTLP